MTARTTQQQVGDLLDELELFLGEMQDDDETFVEDMLQREMESCEFSVREIARLHDIRAKYIYDLPES